MVSGDKGSPLKSIKLICTDVDGTLLNSNNEMLESTKKAIKRASEAGIPTAITTGKSPTGTWLDDVTPHLPDNMPSVFCQGSLLVDKEGNIIDQESIEPEHIKRIIEFGKKHDLTVIAYCNNDVVAVKQNDDTKNLLEIKEMEPRGVGPLEDYLLKDDSPSANKMAFLGSKERIEEMQSVAQEEFKDVLTVMITLDGLLECMPQNATKGHGVEKLLKHLKIDKSELFALGDGSNDATFLELAGVAIAMGNGADKIKEIATWVAPANDDDGWATAVNRLLDGEPFE